MVGRPTDEKRIKALEDEALRLKALMDAKRGELTEIRAQRKVVLEEMVKAIGAQETARRLKVTRQAIYAAMRD